MLRDLTKGNETKAMISFAIPMIIGSVFQQLYNIVDTIIVGQFIGAGALAAVGSSYTLMVFLTSIILGLCMGSGVLFSMFFGGDEEDRLKRSIFTSFWFIAIITIIITILSLFFIDEILAFIKIPNEVMADTRGYLKIVFYGIGFTFLYNYFAALLRSMGNSITPLIFLIIAALINIVLDIIFVVPLRMGVEGAAWATFIAQNKGANKNERIRRGIRSAVKLITIFSITISILVVVFARPLMRIFVKAHETEVINIGVKYLYIEGSLYVLIGYLFMFYGLYRGYGKVSMSIILTVISLGTRVALAYGLASIPAIGMVGIWWSIPIGWALADIVGYLRLKKLYSTDMKNLESLTGGL